MLRELNVVEQGHQAVLLLALPAGTSSGIKPGLPAGLTCSMHDRQPQG
jgi:hypothetical protein